MVKARHGRGSLGCLFTLLLVAAGVYFGLPVGEAYFRYYKFEDRMKTAVRFARLNPDAEIRTNLRAYADSLGLPAEAQEIFVERKGGRIIVSSTYAEEFHLPGYVRVQEFDATVVGTY